MEIEIDKDWQVKDFQYDLPSDLIAKTPSVKRGESRLLQVLADGRLRHFAAFNEILGCLRQNDHLIFNNTRVMAARFYGEKATGGKIEVLIERILSDNEVKAHIRASKSPKVDTELYLADGAFKATVCARDGDLFCLKLAEDANIYELMATHGQLPLPPYIDRAPTTDDWERYQTVYSNPLGSVAAPTAGLHFDNEIFEKLRAKGIKTSFLTLHVGAGTFQPVRTRRIAEHHMHKEYFDISSLLCDEIRQTQAQGGRIIAVGTTVVRALESAARHGGLQPYSGETDIFIHPGFQFQVIDALVTNFHLPGSTLLMLVAAFCGFDNIKRAYQIAVEQQYRFFSYGDAMFIERGESYAV